MVGGGQVLRGPDVRVGEVRLLVDGAALLARVKLLLGLRTGGGSDMLQHAAVLQGLVTFRVRHKRAPLLQGARCQILAFHGGKGLVGIDALLVVRLHLRVCRLGGALERQLGFKLCLACLCLVFVDTLCNGLAIITNRSL